MDNMLQAKLDLRIELEIGKRMDDSIIPNKINKIFNDIFVKDDSKSPFRNVLAAATEPGTSIEVIKNYIRYQVGRSGSSEIWKTKKEKNGKIFAQEVVEHIQELQDDAENITKDLEKSIYQTISLDSRLNKEEKNQKLKELNQQLPELKKKIHLRLTQLYLGYLAREHTALSGERKVNNKKTDRTDKTDRPILNKSNRR